MAKKTTNELKQWFNKQMQRTEEVKKLNHKTEGIVYEYSTKAIAILRGSSTVTGFPYYVKNERLGHNLVTNKLIVERGDMRNDYL
jgi:hypothetical protein